MAYHDDDRKNDDDRKKRGKAGEGCLRSHVLIPDACERLQLHRGWCPPHNGGVGCGISVAIPENVVMLAKSGSLGATCRQGGGGRGEDDLPLLRLGPEA
jgi:hypothetical protein